MAYSVVLSGAPDQTGPESFELCSIGAWGKFCAWAKTLEGSPALNELVASGERKGTDALSAELLDAQALAPPTDPGVLATLAALVSYVGCGDPAETITVSGD
jgi:hypothetical protein